MKKFYLLLLLSTVVDSLLAQDAFRMRKLAQYNNPNLPVVDGTDIWNDLTGYYDPLKKREYIVAGGTDSVYFFDITDPSQMKLVDVEYGASTHARNRDFETYQHYAYCVADQVITGGALQVFDLQYLPDSVHKVYESADLGRQTHTIFVDSLSRRMYMCSNKRSNSAYPMDLVSLANPEVPAFMATLTVPQAGGFPLFNDVHEMFVRNDTAYLSCGTAGLHIFDLRDTLNHVLISSIISYPDRGYNHSSWLNSTGRYLMFTDENMGLDVKIFDLKNIGEPIFVSQFNSNEQATPHNAIWVGNLAYVSAYHDGVRIFNVKDPANPKQAAWYDTHPETPEIYGGYKGCWGVYPFLPSGHIIASDLTSGIFVFEVDSNLDGLNNPQMPEEARIYPNPATDKLYLETAVGSTCDIEITDMQGSSCVRQHLNNAQSAIDVSALAPGVYCIRVQSRQSTFTRKWIRL